MQPIGR